MLGESDKHFLELIYSWKAPDAQREEAVTATEKGTWTLFLIKIVVVVRETL